MLTKPPGAVVVGVVVCARSCSDADCSVPGRHAVKAPFCVLTHCTEVDDVDAAIDHFVPPMLMAADFVPAVRETATATRSAVVPVATLPQPVGLVSDCGPSTIKPSPVGTAAAVTDPGATV